MGWRENFRMWRERRGLSQVELGRKMTPRLSGPSIHQWESGTTTPTLDKFLAACRALDVAPSVVLGDVAEPSAAEAEILALARAIGLDVARNRLLRLPDVPPTPERPIVARPADAHQTAAEKERDEADRKAGRGRRGNNHAG